MVALERHLLATPVETELEAQGLCERFRVVILRSKEKQSMLLFLFLTEQRKKYSNSNVIMHETSQYHVQVSTHTQWNAKGLRGQGQW